jgi:hypothetical protein
MDAPYHISPSLEETILSNGTANAKGIPHESSSTSIANTLLGGTSKPITQSADDLRRAREIRASEALRMKDDQLQMLNDQNAKLLTSMGKVSNPKLILGRLTGFIL